MTSQLKGRPIPQGAGADDVTGLHMIGDGDIRNELGAGIDRAFTHTRCPHLTVHGGPSLEIVEGGQLVDRRYPRSDAVGEVLALLGSHSHPHLARLNVTRAEVVEDRQAEEGVLSLLDGQISAALANDVT